MYQVFLNYTFIKKQREDVNLQLLIVPMFICIHAVSRTSAPLVEVNSTYMKHKF